MDLPSFLIGLLPVVAVGFACVVAFRHRHDRGDISPLVVDPHTLAVEPNADAHGHLPFVNPAPATTRSLTMDTPSVTPEPGDHGAQLIDPAAPTGPPKNVSLRLYR